MCKYCDKEVVIFENKNYQLSPLWMNPTGTYTGEEIEKMCEYTEGLFIDKRCETVYLRLADLIDCNYIESGKKIEITFCPYIGGKLV